MTIIEFFERESHVENIISTLLCAPDKVIFLGDSKKKIDWFIPQYDAVAKKRGINVKFESKSINRNNLMSIVGAIEDVVKNNDDCIIDLSGGDDLALVAIGIVYADNADKIKLHRFSITNSKMTDCDSDGILCKSAPAELTVDEIVAINGGRVIYTDEKSNGTYRWDFNKEFVEDVRVMWSICKRDPSEWNNQIAILCRLLTVSCDPESLYVNINLKEAANILCRITEKNKEIKTSFYKILSNHRIITDFKADNENISFRFKNEQIKKCLTKSGQVFELFIATSAMALKDDDGNPIYTDVKAGVFIDWDGELHPGTSKDVENEIDVVLMKGLMPVFISCKNGGVDINELFKLSVVAGKFGGKYVRTVLAATEIDKAEEKVEYVRIRADAMGIKPWFKIHNMDEYKYESELSNLWKSQTEQEK